MQSRADFRDVEDFLETEYRTVPDPGGGGGGRRGPLGDADGGGGQTIEEVAIPRSDRARGLALTHLNVARGWDSLFSLLGRANQVYFLSISYDLSGEPPQVMPPKELTGNTFIRLRPKETYEFTLGDGAPIFMPRQIVGGLAVFVQLCEADDVDKVGATMKKIHEDLEDDSASLIDRVKKLIKNPAAEGVSQVLSAGSALLKPIATVLEANGDDHVGLVQGTFPARKAWEGRLVQNFGDGSFLRFAEITDDF
jgi:hypothetical protein